VNKSGQLAEKPPAASAKIALKSVMKILRPVLALFLMGVLPAASNARTALGALEGTVIDARGRAVASAAVTIQTSDGQHPHATRTDGTGQFSFSRFLVGQYDVRACSNGSCSDWAKRIPIRSKKATQVTLRIPFPKP